MAASDQIRQMVNFILQEAHEKANEIRVKVGSFQREGRAMMVFHAQYGIYVTATYRIVVGDARRPTDQKRYCEGERIESSLLVDPNHFGVLEKGPFVS